MTDQGAAETRWAKAAQAAAIFAIDPVGTGGVALRALPGAERDHWLAWLRQGLPAGSVIRRIPLQITDGRLLGGLDLAATLQSGRPIAERGVLADADGGIVMLSMAERVTASVAAKISAVLDVGEVSIERDGLARRFPSRIGVVALDEGIEADERPSSALLDRLAFHIDLSGLRLRDAGNFPYALPQLEAARRRLSSITSTAAIQEAFCVTAMALGIPSLRAVLLCQAVARCAAALAGRDEISEADAELAGRLVLASRAMALPAQQPDESDETDKTDESDESEESGEDRQPPPADDPAPDRSPAENPPPQQESGDDSVAPDQDERAGAETDSAKALNEVVLEATIASIPDDLLKQLQSPPGSSSRARSSGRTGVLKKSSGRGRPTGVKTGEPRGGVRLNVLETLRAAAPWQRLRRAQKSGSLPENITPARIEVRREDFRINRYKQRSQTTTIFLVDASGSSALNRLAEVKGAVELLLAECYVRRDRVAVIAFRGRAAEILLSPTRSLARAKRSLAGLPGGGGTPLAAGIDAAVTLAEAVVRSGDAPTIVLLTDGRANVARDGTGDRVSAEADAMAAARQARLANLSVLFIDTSPRVQPIASRLAAEMRAVYLALPHANSSAVSAAVKSVNASTRRDSKG